MTPKRRDTRPEIQTRPDGSIDVAFYMQRGRTLRGEAATGFFGLGATDRR